MKLGVARFRKHAKRSHPSEGSGATLPGGPGIGVVATSEKIDGMVEIAVPPVA